MIAKILRNSKGFQAVGYNERKVEKNLADFVEAYNFGYLNILDRKRAIDYERYFKQWGEKNSNVKNKQLHAAISCKGREYTKNELVNIAKQWLHEMKYDGLPTMIYYHRDTNNSHVHVITSRIGVDGKKIDDSFEKYRSRQAINRIMNNDIKYKCREDFAKALTYKFENQKQFMLVLESLGYKVDVSGDNIFCLKENEVLLQKKVEIVDWAIKKVDLGDYAARLKQLKAIFIRYRNTMDIDNFKVIMKDNFGVDLTFFGKKQSPYGYAVIDNAKKHVFKGNSIMNMKDLLKSDEKRIEQIVNAVNLLVEEGNITTTKNLANYLRRYGMILKGDAIMSLDGIPLFYLDGQIKEKLSYNDRISGLNGFTISSSILDSRADYRRALSDIFNLKSEDIISASVSDKGKDYYSGLIKGRSLYELNELGIYIAGDDNPLLIDSKNKHIYSLDELELDDKVSLKNRTDLFGNTGDFDIIDRILDVIPDSNIEGGMGGADNKLRKKKKR